MEKIESIALSYIISTILGVVGKIIYDKYENSKLKRKCSNKIWRCKSKWGSFDSFFIYLFICAFMPVIIIVITCISYLFLSLSFPEVDIKLYALIIGIILYFFIVLSLNLFYVPQKELLDNKNNKIAGKQLKFIWNTLIADSFFMYTSFFSEFLYFKIFIAFFVIFLFEIWGIIYLDNKPILQFSKIKIVLEDNKSIINIKSDSFYVNAKWFVDIQCSGKEEKEIRVPQDKVRLIEYYNKQF